MLLSVQQLDHVQVTVVAKFAMITVLHKTLDGCQVLVDLKTKERCPLPSKNTTTVVEQYIPKIIPSVSYLSILNS